MIACARKQGQEVLREQQQGMFLITNLYRVSLLFSPFSRMKIDYLSPVCCKISEWSVGTDMPGMHIVAPSLLHSMLTYIYIYIYICTASKETIESDPRDIPPEKPFSRFDLERSIRAQLVYCMTITTYSKPRGMFNIGLTAGQAWELPSKSTLSNKFKDYHRRSRRELYRKLELLLAR